MKVNLLHPRICNFQYFLFEVLTRACQFVIKCDDNSVFRLQLLILFVSFMLKYI